MKRIVKTKYFGFNSFKIGTKLVIGFIIVALLSGVVGSIGLFNMSKSNKYALEIYRDKLIPIRDLSTVNLNLLRIRSNNIYMLYNKDMNDFNQREKQNIELDNENKVLLEKYENSFLVGEEVVLLDQFNKDLKPYITIRKDFEKYLKNGNETEAQKILQDFVVAREAVEKDLQNLIEENNLQAETLVQNINKNYRESFIFMVLIIVIGFALAIVLGLYLAHKIGKPIKGMLAAANKIADGDLDVELDVHSRDEIGEMAKAFNNMTDNLNRVMSNINSSSEQVAAGAGQVSDSSTSLSQGATEQASSIEELTATVEEISTQTKQNATNAHEAKDIAEGAKVYASQGNAQMQEMLSAMSEINNSSNNISKIIKVIDEIAFQTNILALNAAVEAARAGQHGKGFAVVAEEVRNLAARSANAAKETTIMIEDSIKHVKGGTEIANKTAEALKKIVEGVTKAANLVGDISLASNEQSIGVQQVNEGITQIAGVVQNTSATSEETAAASEELSSQAQLLKDEVRTFKLKNRKSVSSEEELIFNKGIEYLGEKPLKILDNSKEIRNSNARTVINLSDNEFEKY
ncbi:methyl-accepting chemotaxis protein [Clostridium grantii]|uniref:Methyl-accepting chemotaxis protein n=1 Tax=Clostridium grantii DSM 8605 TaxID=1121316 RepID=A0A1M5TQA3_9CLOT|nr:methyl-accepting chemotaxis protein [Clostridium grantii]SHH52858.1 methyl-accepting chemotaxis protein [Clostridium grantii DSM 8605]